MLIGLLIKCLSGSIHTVLWHPQLLFNLCPAIVHLFNWLEVRRSGKGSSSPYHSTAQCDANSTTAWLTWMINDMTFTEKQSTTEVNKSADQHARSSDEMFPIKIYFLKQKQLSNCYVSTVKHVPLVYWVVTLWFVQRWQLLILQAGGDK